MPKSIDLSGLRAGLLTVVSRSADIIAKSGRRQTAWLCRCDCGAECVIASNNLCSGNSKSCGCQKRKPHRRRDLSGIRFGRLSVISYSHTTARGQSVWSCICDCGQATKTKATALTRGKVKSCGCYRAEGRFHLGIGPVKWARIVKDDSCCLRCESFEDLHAHHIVPVSADQTLERSLFNGACLCAHCHRAFHAKYGKETAGLDDLADFCGIRNEEKEVIRTLIRSSARQDIEKAIHELQLLLELRYPLAPDRADLGDFLQQNQWPDDDSRIDIIGTNGNCGQHYGHLWR